MQASATRFLSWLVVIQVAVRVINDCCSVVSLKISEPFRVERHRLQAGGLERVLSATGIALHEHGQLFTGDREECILVKGRGEHLRETGGKRGQTTFSSLVMQFNEVYRVCGVRKFSQERVLSRASPV